MTALQQILNIDVFIQVGPVYATAVTNQSPANSLVRRAMPQPRVPSEWYGKDPPIGQLNGQRILRDDDVASGGDQDFSYRRTHSNSPAGSLIVLDDLLDPVQVLAREPTASLQADRVEPELGFAINTLDMDVGWFVPIA